MANVGSLNIKIVADASQVQEGAAKAGAAMSAFVDKSVSGILGLKGAFADAKGAFDSLKSSIGSGISSGLGGIKSWFDGSALSGAGGVYGILKSGLGAGVSGVGSLISSGMGAASGFIAKVQDKFAELAPVINEARKEAVRLGTDVATVQGFGKLGLDEAGLRKFRLKNGEGNLFEGVLKVADEIAALQSPTDQAGMAFDRFGKNGVQYLDQLKRGSAALREDFARFKGMGLLTSDDDAAKVGAAQKAIGRLKDMWAGFWIQTTVAVAPAVEQWASRFRSIEPLVAQLGQRVGVLLGEGLKVVSNGIAAIVMDVMKLGDVFGFMNGKAGGMFGTLADWTRLVKEGLRSVALAFGDMFDVVRANLGPLLEKLGDSMTLAQRFALSGAWGIVIDANKKDATNDPGQAIKALGQLLGGAGIAVGQTRAAMLRRFKEQDFFDSLGAMGPHPPQGGAFADSMRADYTPVSVMEQASKEANSVIARWRTEGMANPLLDVGKQQLQVQKEIAANTRVRQSFNVTDREKLAELDI